jgi:peptidoglycan/LPS O-acetylase OafA/YrhL
MTTSQRNIAIDFLRTSCLLYIIGYWHLLSYTHPPFQYRNHFTIGLTVVSLGTFVFISGFLLARKKIELNFQSVLGFYQQRIVRIYPLYFIALLIYPFTGLPETSIAKAALLISMFHPPAPFTLWFVTMIMVFYLIAPFLICLADNKLKFSILTLAIMAAFLIFHLFINSIDTRLLVYFPSFAFGIIFQQQKAIQQFLYQKKTILVATLILFFFLSLLRQETSLSRSFLLIPLSLNGALVFFTYANFYESKIGFRSIISFLSYASFSMYLFHRIIFTLAMESFFPSQEILKILYLVFFALPLVIAISWTVQKLYDAGFKTVSELRQPSS